MGSYYYFVCHKCKTSSFAYKKDPELQLNSENITKFLKMHHDPELCPQRNFELVYEMGFDEDDDYVDVCELSLEQMKERSK